ncbi:9676_t:CDS:1, partial [Acaulospora colombiana]
AADLRKVETSQQHEKPTTHRRPRIRRANRIPKPMFPPNRTNLFHHQREQDTTADAEDDIVRSEERVEHIGGFVPQQMLDSEN